MFTSLSSLRFVKRKYNAISSLNRFLLEFRFLLKRKVFLLAFRTSSREFSTYLRSFLTSYSDSLWILSLENVHSFTKNNLKEVVVRKYLKQGWGENIFCIDLLGDFHAYRHQHLGQMREKIKAPSSKIKFPLSRVLSNRTYLYRVGRSIPICLWIPSFWMIDDVTCEFCEFCEYCFSNTLQIIWDSNIIARLSSMASHLTWPS